ncbi:MAG: winged helix-turn-helix domain-containing protein [Candidatus Nitrosotenuis sp.]
MKTRQKQVSATKSSTKALEEGPLESMFPCSASKILDFLCVFKKYDYSISDIAKNSGITFKTALHEVRKLEKQQVIVNSRTVGNAKMYQLNPDSVQAQSINKLAMDLAFKRLQKSILDSST